MCLISLMVRWFCHIREYPIKIESKSSISLCWILGRFLFITKFCDSHSFGLSCYLRSFGVSGFSVARENLNFVRSVFWRLISSPKFDGQTDQSDCSISRRDGKQISKFIFLKTLTLTNSLKQILLKKLQRLSRETENNEKHFSPFFTRNQENST